MTTTLVFDERGFGTDGDLVLWRDLKSVGIRTTSEGPWAEDVYWWFVLSERVIEIPNSAMNEKHIAVLQAQLPSFDDEKLILAMGSTKNRMFRVWYEGAAQRGWEDARFRSRFAALVERLGGDARAAGQGFEMLAGRWSEPGRHYHNREHLAGCLYHLD